jgi:hypothetical protein
MDFKTIEMPRTEARQRFLEYKREVEARHKAERREARTRRTTEIEQIMAGYRQLARGKQLVELRSTMHDVGVDHRGLPRLAISRADADTVYLAIRNDGSAVFRIDRWDDTRATRRRVALPADTFARLERTWGRDATFWEDAKAMVPIVPPALRPKAKLERYHVLWEPRWQRIDTPRPRPPRDPALLRHIGGTLYAVVALWDLTDLERAVLGGRS